MPGPFCHVNDVSIYLGRQRGGGGGLIERTYLVQTFLVLNQELYVLLQTCETSALGTETTRKWPQAQPLFQSGTPPVLCLHAPK